ncbi:MAG: DUF5686 family protein [Bacteroidota bacterium]
MSRLFFSLCLLCFPLSLISQDFTISGRVCDSATLEPLAFVNIVINNGRQGGVSDIDGRFTLRSDVSIHTLGFSYVGYNKLVLPVGIGPGNLWVKLVRFETELSEVLIVAGDNPAHRIIRNAVENRKINNPANIPSYAFTSYDKMIFTINADSLKGDGTTPLDSSDIRLLEVIEKQHLFIMESVAEHKYLYPDRSHDRIIATRVSGLKDPLFVFLISQMQSASFYGDLIIMAGTSYLNPVSPDSDKLYFFHLKDTIYGEQSGDTTFVIGYKPRPGKNFDGMKGLLYISNNRWAIRNVIAEPARPNESFGMRIQQMYEFISGRQWFPVQLNTEVTFNTINLNKSKPVGIGKSYRRDINLDAEIIGRELSNIAVEITPEAARQNESLWNQYRIDSLTRREINTYHVIDSLGRANSFDSKLKGLSALLSGKLPLGYVDLDLNRILRYNAYEGFYLGLGLHTSDRLSGRASLGGYAGYGFADKDVKYGTDLLVKLERYGNYTLKLSYTYDLEESGGTTYFDDELSVFSPGNYRKFYITRMDINEKAEAMAGFRMLRYIKAGIGISWSYKQAAYDYTFRHSQDDPYVLTSDHTIGKLVAGIRFAWGEKFIRSTEKQASLGTRFPVLWIQYTGSRKGMPDGQFNYDRFDVKMNYSFLTRLVGKTSIQLAGGLINRPAPCSELFNGHGSRASTISVFSPGSFATMRTDEFLNDRFAAVFVTHNFGNLLFRTENFEPEFAVLFNAGTGSLKEPWRHRFSNEPAVSMAKGYYEGGFLVNNLLKSSISGLGFGLFCRMGPYSFDLFEKNLTFKLSLSFNL